MDFHSRFDQYFQKPVAIKAAHPLKNGARMGFLIRSSPTEATPLCFTFLHEDGKNLVLKELHPDTDVNFFLTHKAAETILNQPSGEISEIGIQILKLIFSDKPDHRIGVRLNSGMLTLIRKGYFGVLTAGGAAFSGYLASKGFSGLGSIKTAINKLRG
jgi:hypothetical protein